MKRVLFLLCAFFILSSCKKDQVDATSTQTLQSSINDMTSSLNTLQQDKFNEALYILKTFGVEAEGDTSELAALGIMINGKKVPEIFLLADQVAQKNGIEWTSTGPPTLGSLNIFEDAKESDPNDVSASSLRFAVNTPAADSILGPKSLQVIPRLLDASGKDLVFSGAALEVEMQIFSNGRRISTSKNLMQDNNFKGFTIRFASLPKDKIADNKSDITISVKTSKKTLKMSKIGVPVNPKALLMPAGNPEDNPANVVIEDPELIPIDSSLPADTKPITPTGDPKTSVSKFLNNLNSQNLRGAYETADNPNWGSFENFSNPTSGFGGVKNVTVKNIATNQSTANTASVNATYDVTDKSGKTTALQVTFGLKNVNGDWKIASYKIN